MRSSRHVLALATTTLFFAATLTGCGAERVTGVVADPPRSSAPAESATPTPTPTPTPTVLPGMEADLPRVARTFLRFARGELPGPPSDTPVGIYLGGELVRTIASADLSDRDRWEGLCPESGAYAARLCPFSVLAPFGEFDDDPRILLEEKATHPCAHPTPLGPADVGGTHRVTLVPNPEGDCTAWVAVELFVNDVSQVVAVDIVWAEP